MYAYATSPGSPETRSQSDRVKTHPINYLAQILKLPTITICIEFVPTSLYEITAHPRGYSPTFLALLRLVHSIKNVKSFNLYNP
jgi:hypothetical protein